MKKINFILIVCFLVLSFCNTSFSIASAENNSPNYMICANMAVLYQSPSFSSEKLENLPHKTEVFIESENNLPKEYINENYVFYKVLEYNGKEGYVLSDLVIKITNQITSVPNFNAQTNKECKVFYLQDTNFVESEITLERKHRIFLYKGYDKNREYTAIAFKYENEIVYGYLKTEDIAPDGINPVVITCVTISIALLGIIFAWLFMKNKKSKRS